MSHKHQNIADKYAGQSCRLYTLDGEFDAMICGRLMRFATIVVPERQMNVEVSWPTVARKMEGDKVFYAC